MTTFKRSFSNKMSKGEWRPVAKEDGSLTANITCPDCGQLMILLFHKIDKDGNVTPSVVGPHTKCVTCGFHDSIKLENWVV